MAYELEDELEVLGEFEDELEGEDEYEDEGELEDEAGEGEGWLGALGNIAGSLLGEGEGEEEGEFEDEYEDEVSPIRKIYPDAMMEHLGELAAEAESEDEAAEQFLPLVGMAASKLLPVVAKAVAPAAKKLLPKIARAVTKSAPHLTKTIGKVARTLHRNPQTRHLLKVVPSIARRTVGSIARQASHGRHITPRTAVHTLARQARKVLLQPHHRKHALQHHHRLEKHFHRYGRGVARPHYGRRHGYRRYGYAPGRYGYAPGYTHTGVPTAPGGTVVTGTGGTRVVPGAGPGRVCTCGAAQGQPAPAPAPAYCRCCGQVIR